MVHGYSQSHYRFAEKNIRRIRSNDSKNSPVSGSEACIIVGISHFDVNWQYSTCVKADRRRYKNLATEFKNFLIIWRGVHLLPSSVYAGV